VMIFIPKAIASPFLPESIASSSGVNFTISSSQIGSADGFATKQA
jgi:hypothetical protein